MLLCLFANADDKTKVRVVDECPSTYKSVTIKAYCVPKNINVTHLEEKTFAPICGYSRCPAKQGDCPTDFSVGQIGAVCVKLPCGGPGERVCPASSPVPPGLEISKNVLATLIG